MSTESAMLSNHLTQLKIDLDAGKDWRQKEKGAAEDEVEMRNLTLVYKMEVKVQTWKVPAKIKLSSSCVSAKG